MRFDLLDNGIDSLKAVGDILKDYYYDNEFEGYQIKDAVFHFMHGVEINMKYLLQEKDEKLIFTNERQYYEAKSQMEKEKLKSVFEANPEIKTIDVMTALKRLTNNTKIKVSKELNDSIDAIRLFRNHLMHYTVNLNDEEFAAHVNLLRNTFEKVLNLFKENIPVFDGKFNNIDREEPETEYDRNSDALADRAMDDYENGRNDPENY
ncbi:hypothetical protein ACQKKK_15205 [Peribacillus sp. NPDC006672]|uniref:hypothetical protein n=1 Tax=Peribacillus sp. NPDC006672 TaxID=3390606 RepID=UPI003D023466